MSYARRFIVPVTTIADGSATVYSDVIDYGLMLQIRYIKDATTPFTDGVDFTITLEGTGETIWDEDNVNSSATRAPRQALHDTVGAALGATIVDKIAIVNDRIKIVLAAGGDTKSGAFHFLIA